MSDEITRKTPVTFGVDNAAPGVDRTVIQMFRADTVYVQAEHGELVVLVNGQPVIRIGHVGKLHMRIER